jgi:hypothetical protein
MMTSESGIGCAIIFTGVPVYFLVISEEYVKKPDWVKRVMGRFGFLNPCFLTPVF